MDGKYGVQELVKFAAALAMLVNAGYRAIRGNLLALWDLLGVARSLKDVDFTKAKLELLDLSAAERLDVQGAFAGALSLPDADLQKKLVEGVGVLESAFQLGEDGVVLFNRGKEFVARVRGFLGLN